MLTNETVSKLQDMHLGAMARRFKEQLEDPVIKDLSFEDRFGILIDTEWIFHVSYSVSIKTASPSSYATGLTVASNVMSEQNTSCCQDRNKYFFIDVH